MYCIFCCHCGENSVFGRIFRCSAKRCNFQQQSVGIGLSQSHKVKYAFEQVWVARRKIFQEGMGGGLLHPSVFAPSVCEHSLGWWREAVAGTGAGTWQSHQGWVSSTSPWPAPAPRGAGCPDQPPPGNSYCCPWFGFSWVLLSLFLCCPTLE